MAVNGGCRHLDNRAPGPPPLQSDVRPIGHDKPMFNVFVSYSTTDLSHVEELKLQLAANEVEIFVAEHSVLAGEDLSKEIKEAIARCDLFVLLWSQEARRSDWVPQEIGIADQQGKLIVPLVLEENLQLTGFISGLKYIDVTKDRQLAFEEAQSRVFEAVEKKKKLEQEKQKQNDALVFGALSLFLFWAFTQK